MKAETCRITVTLAVAASMLVQTAIGQTTASRFDRHEREMDERVVALIKAMLNRKTEQRAFADLEALGCAAVPAIITRMDDRRDLPDPRIALRNKSRDAFEGQRFYGPKKIVDALAAILNQMTGEDFGSIYNGEVTEAERTKAVAGWRDFLSKTPKSRLCDRG